MRKTTSGFTIVELLIVIVVIAILATISIIAYNGIQQRAKNTQTIAAVTQWVKALQMYKVDNGSYPGSGNASCLGTGYGTGFSGSESSGGQCRQDSAIAGIVTSNSSFLSLMDEYINGNPTPALVTAGSSSFPWFRGAYYYPASTGERVDFVLAGSDTPCPAISGLTVGTGNVYETLNSRRCTGVLAQ